ncbi:hypothetical protein H1R20_g6915, partial [Candolleomyces eurysporus]
MYSQAHYGQPSYSGHHYPPPPVNSYYGHQHQQHYIQHPPVPQISAPPPVYHIDPTTFRSDYMRSLADLTFNSRPIIERLSLLAQDYSRHADIVVSCVETHIRRVQPSMKLPAFYLLDSVSKNVHDPYARKFAPVIVRLFLDTYGQVDPKTRQKMEEMLLTWRNGSPTRSEVFGAVNQLAIERGVWGEGGDLSITKGQVLSELQFAIDQKKRALSVNQYDTDAQTKIEVLYQLRKCITEVGVSQDELRQILGQLRELVKSAPPVTQPVPPPPANNWANPPYPASRIQPPHPASAPSYPTDPSTYPSAGYPNPQPPAVPQPTSSSMPALPDTEKLSSIINSLVSAGVVGPPRVKAASNAPNLKAPQPATSTSSDDWKDYKKTILGQKSKLSTLDILRTKPAIKSLLYDRLSSQCKQCGLRFSDSASGTERHQQHLDMHFKHNRRAAQSAGRGHSRASFLGVDDWIHNSSGNDKGKSRATSATQSEAGIPVPSVAELRSRFVVVPPGDEAKHISCPICKEQLKSEFLEDDEEWVWRNAVSKDDKIYHATCHAEALSSTSLAARLRNDIGSGSRGATPEVTSSSRSTPPPSSLSKSSRSPTPDSKAGLKRKDRDSESTEDPTGTPPTKKIAVAAVY